MLKKIRKLPSRLLLEDQVFYRTIFSKKEIVLRGKVTIIEMMMSVPPSPLNLNGQSL